MRSALLVAALAGSACVCSQGKDDRKATPPGTASSTASGTGSATGSGTSSSTGDSPVDVPPGEDALLGYVLGFELDDAKAKTDMAEFTRSPHPFGSERQKEIIAWLEARLQEGGARVVRDSFVAATPNPAVSSDQAGPVANTVDLAGVNVVALDSVKSEPACAVALGTHFDTKVVPGTSYVGANDGGSSTIALLHQLAYLKAQKAGFDLSCDIIGLFFDGEEAVLLNWTDGQVKHPARIQDNTYGSRSLAGRLTDCSFEGKAAKCLPDTLGGKPLVALVLMDMIGSPSLKISRDSLSTKALSDLAAAGAKALGVENAYDKSEHAVQDDHVPFLSKGVPAVDLIDFNNLDYWHRAGDTSEKLSYDSIETAGRIALFVALSVARAPKDYLDAR